MTTITINRIIEAFESADTTPKTWVNGIISAERVVSDKRVKVAAAWQELGDESGWSIYYQVERLDERWGWVTIVDESAGIDDVSEIKRALNLI